MFAIREMPHPRPITSAPGRADARGAPTEPTRRKARGEQPRSRYTDSTPKRGNCESNGETGGGRGRL